MKILHLSDLHIGKRVNEFSMLEDQRYILLKILEIIDEKNVDAVIIAGDVYDKTVPSAEAVELFDSFLTKLASRELAVFVISGNHDSAERIAFGSRIMKKSNVYMSQVYDGKIEPVSLEDEYGQVNFYLMPFVKPSHVRRFFEEEEIQSYNDALHAAVGHMNIDTAMRNIIVSHQFVTGALTCQSEELSVGGIDNVDVSVYEPFDYAALGHIHGPQHILSEHIRYCGTPLKYSFSEISHVKSVTLVEMGKKGHVSIDTIPLKPMRDMQEIRGKYMELVSKAFYEKLNREDYFHIILTDEEDVVNAAAKLRVIYPHMMKISYDNTRTSAGLFTVQDTENERKSPIELLDELYELQNGQKMNDNQRTLSSAIFEQLREENI